MTYTIHEGDYEKMGVTCNRDRATFTFYGEKEDDCALVLIHKTTGERTQIAIPAAYCLGSLRSVTISGLQMKHYYYGYLINGKEVLDDYAPMIAGREVWNDASRAERDYRVYGASVEDHFEWEEDHSPEISASDMILYKLHVRGFSMDRRVRDKGTFKAVEAQIPYLKGLGVTTVEFMPVYEFEEMPLPEEVPPLPDYVKWDEEADDLITKPQVAPPIPKQLNYWGYCEGNYFAVKASYASRPANASMEFKHLVHSFHENDMECVMEMFFPDGTNHNLVMDALRYWVREYHVDGFHLLGNQLPLMAIVQDVILSRTKIFYMEDPSEQFPRRRYERLYVYREDYQYPTRRILNHFSGNLGQLVEQQRRQGHGFGYVNYISSNNGFTLADVFMYNDKHTEANGENNLDGDTWNFSSNYGVEGPTRRKKIVAIRTQQWKNAMAMIMLAQGVPLIWQGDECGNSQSGNNNAYCQDNPVGWVNWKTGAAAVKQLDFLRQLIAFRKDHPIIAPKEPFAFADPKGSGFPDLSYHGRHAWISDADYGSLCVGMLYNGSYEDEAREGVSISEMSRQAKATRGMRSMQVEPRALPLTGTSDNKIGTAVAGTAVDPASDETQIKASTRHFDLPAELEAQLPSDGSEDVYVAYNFYSEETALALPQLGRKRAWHLVMCTALEDSWLAQPKPLESQYVNAPAQSISILLGW